jgi:hypothetical protein
MFGRSTVDVQHRLARQGELAIGFGTLSYLAETLSTTTNWQCCSPMPKAR